MTGPDAVADIAIEATRAQHTTLPGETVAARLVKDLAERILALDESVCQIERQIRESFHALPLPIISSVLSGLASR